jgi:alpha-D-ribose 1-methylphosphonate 5-triphosphate diphosphatase PhnM
VRGRLHDHRRFSAVHRGTIIRVCATQGTPLASHDDATVAYVEEAAKAGTAVAEFPTTLETAHACRAYDDRGEITVGKRADLIRVRTTEDAPIVAAVWTAGGRVA